MSQRFRASILCADSKPCRSLRNTARVIAAAKWFFEALAVNHFRCGKIGMMYLLGRSRRPRLFRPARFKKRGGRANRRRCARWRRFPSDCRSKPHSNMRNAVLCRNFSRWGIRVPQASNKRNTKQASRETQGEAPERVKKRAD
jgi:hypothetical protein